MVKISIIIPVYNTEKYLKKCLGSLINQTLDDIEIICVDDGSTDNSCEILKGFAIKDKRVKVITQKNKGQSVARNAGIKIAQGEYIGFLDSDDWADETMFEKLYENAKKYDSDISMCSINVYDEKTGKISANDPYLTLELFPKSLFKRAFSYKDCLDFIFRICVVPWNKIYRRKFLQDKNLRFIENLNFEDNVFNLKTFVEASKISLIREPLVYYRRASETSYTFGSDDSKKLDFFRVMDLQEEFLKEKDLYEELKEYFLKTKKNTLVYWYKKLHSKEVKEEYYKRFLALYPKDNL